MKVSVQFHRQDFIGTSTKEAYLEACKWVAKNVVSNEVEIGETFWRITRQDADSPTVRLELHALLDAGDSFTSFCGKCKEFHSLFYLNQQFNCDTCTHATFKQLMESKLKTKQHYRKEKLGHFLARRETD